MIKIGDTIETPDGIGVVVNIEEYSRLGSFKRYCVQIPNSIFPTMCYFEDEVKLINNQTTLF